MIAIVMVTINNRVAIAPCVAFGPGLRQRVSRFCFLLLAITSRCSPQLFVSLVLLLLLAVLVEPPSLCLQKCPASTWQANYIWQILIALSKQHFRTQF
jgi:hypothetical protein